MANPNAITVKCSLLQPLKATEPVMHKDLPPSGMLAAISLYNE